MALMSMNDKAVWDELKYLYDEYNEGRRYTQLTPEGKEDIYECLEREFLIEESNPTLVYKNWVLTDFGKSKVLDAFKEKEVCEYCGK